MVNVGQVASLVGARIFGKKIGGLTADEISKNLGKAEQKLYQNTINSPLAYQRNFAFGKISSGGGTSLDPYLRDASGKPIGSRARPEDLGQTNSIGGIDLGTPIQSLESGKVLTSTGKEISKSKAQQLIKNSPSSSNLNLPLSSRGLPESYIGDVSGGKSFLDLQTPTRNLNQETYDTRTKMFVSSPYGIGAGGTAIFRQPTFKESERINRANQIGNFQNLPRDVKLTTFGISGKSIGGDMGFGEKALDFVSAGGRSAKKLDEELVKINKDIEKFNKKYGNRDLSEEEINEAIKERNRIEKNLRDIEQEKQDIIDSPFYKTSAFIFGRAGTGELNPITDPETGERIKFYEGSLPITPASGISSVGSLKFVGTQKVGQADDILTDLVFVTNKGRTGIVSGISRRGEDDLIRSIVGGRSGRLGVGLPSGNVRASKIQSFVGRGIGKQKGINAKTVDTFESEGKELFKVLNNEEIDLTKNLGFGESAVVKGRKFFKGKKPVPVNKDLSKIESFVYQGEDDLLDIVGGAKSAKGNKLTFKGKVKRIDSSKADEGIEVLRSGKPSGKGQKLNLGDAQDQALKDVIENVASSLGKNVGSGRQIVGGVATGGRTVLKTTKSKNIQKVQQQPKSLEKEIQNLTSLESTSLDTKQKSGQITKIKSKERTKQKTDTLATQLERQLQSQALKLNQPLKQQQQQKLIQPRNIFSTTNFPFGLRVLPIPRRKRKKTKEVMPEEIKSVDVYIKPPKKKRYVKITKKPITLNEGRDTRNYFLDQSTSRQGYLKKRQTNPSPNPFDIPRGYSQATENKFRRFKQKKGKRTPLKRERVIERGKFLIDTIGEKKQLDIFKAMAQAERKKKKITSSKKPVGLNFA